MPIVFPSSARSFDGIALRTVAAFCTALVITSCGSEDGPGADTNPDTLGTGPTSSQSTTPSDTTAATSTPTATTPSVVSTPGSTTPASNTSPAETSPTPSTSTSDTGPGRGPRPRPTASPSSTSDGPGRPEGAGGGASPQPDAAGGSSGGPGGDPEPDPSPSGSSTSAGCGQATSLQSGAATIDVGGTTRDYILDIPDGYDPSQPYKLIWGLHWRGGSMSDVATGGTVGLGDYYGLKDLAQGSVIFVSPDGIDDGWANSGGRDIEFFRALLDRLEGELCIDLDRIFSVGFSFGGMMSFALACDMADVFRAIAPLSGALYSGCGNGTEPIAMWGAHGLSDNVVPIDDGRAGLAEVLERNHCSDQSMPTTPDTCVEYQGCDEGYPVTWCEFDGGHGPQRWQVDPIWEFFSQF